MCDEGPELLIGEIHIHHPPRSNAINNQHDTDYATNTHCYNGSRYCNDVTTHYLQFTIGRVASSTTTSTTSTREFGKTAWNEDGIKYYNDTLKVWKKMFSSKNGNVFYATLKGGWEEWLKDVGSDINPAGWTRKDLLRVLATREEGEMAMDQDKDMTMMSKMRWNMTLMMTGHQ